MDPARLARVAVTALALASRTGATASAAPASARVVPAGARESARASSISFVDRDGHAIDPSSVGLELTRMAPPARPELDPASFAVEVAVADDWRDRAPAAIVVESRSATGSVVDSLPSVALSACAVGRSCVRSAPLRLVPDATDREHALARASTLRAEVGGSIVARVGDATSAVRVIGFRGAGTGPGAALRATVRAIVVRSAPSSGPALGGTDEGATTFVRDDLASAAALLGACGVTFGNSASAEVRIVDPPPPHLVALGDPNGLPASGGEIRFGVDGRAIRVPVARGASPLAAARQLAGALARSGFAAVVTTNARSTFAADAGADVSVRRSDGTLATLEPLADQAITTDATLSVRIGSVSLSRGLRHFGDDDAATGTLEERTLVKAYADSDPSTIDVFYIPNFAGVGRIGESFIASEGASMRNVILIDRTGSRAGRVSYTLAHELVHVLAAVSGHPDDFGVDTPTELLDSDAADASPFGPRRLPVTLCERILHESGPRSRQPLLRSVPLAPLPSR